MTCVLCGCSADVEHEDHGDICRSCESAVRGNLLGATNIDFIRMKERLWGRYRAIEARYTKDTNNE